jgi:hypothetical protein
MQGGKNMAKTKASGSETLPMRPALTPDAREKQLISLAVDEAEKRLRNGTASSQLICHFLKMGSPREQLERERLEEENKKLRAQTEAIESQKNVEALYKDAIQAMKRYSGNGDLQDGY